MWQHPTGKLPKIVTLLCLGPSQHDYISSCMEHIIDGQIIESDEIWTLNRGIWCYQHDLLFVMDHLWGEAENSPEYGAKLWAHNRPIITSDNAEGWPEHIHYYPFSEICDWLKEINPQHGDWWHNSVAYIFAYAAFIGIKELRVWGADYHHHRSGRVEDGHANVAYWAGVLERTGLIIRPTNSSTLLGADQRDYIYGYKNDPRNNAINKRNKFLKLINKQKDIGNA